MLEKVTKGKKKDTENRFFDIVKGQPLSQNLA